MTNNLKYSLFEEESSNDYNQTTYDDIIQQVEEEERKHSNDSPTFGEVTLDDITAMELEYDMNYTKKDLIKIAEYYEIGIRKKNKSELISEIVIFETQSENSSIVERRKEMWFYINEIREDKYLSKYLIFD